MEGADEVTVLKRGAILARSLRDHGLLSISKIPACERFGLHGGPYDARDQGIKGSRDRGIESGGG